MTLQPADKAWIVLGAGVLLWDSCCGDGETLSEACDRWLLNHKWLTRAGVAAVALHLANGVPPSVDPIHGLFVLTRKWRRAT